MAEAFEREEEERERQRLALEPPRCDCAETMVLRQTTLLNSPDFSRWYWKCPKRGVGCGRREWDDTVPRNTEELLNKLTILL